MAIKTLRQKTHQICLSLPTSTPSHSAVKAYTKKSLAAKKQKANGLLGYNLFNMKTLNHRQDGFITMIVLLIIIVASTIVFVYMRILKANNS